MKNIRIPRHWLIDCRLFRVFSSCVSTAGFCSRGRPQQDFKTCYQISWYAGISESPSTTTKNLPAGINVYVRYVWPFPSTPRSPNPCAKVFALKLNFVGYKTGTSSPQNEDEKILNSTITFCTTVIINTARGIVVIYLIDSKLRRTGSLKPKFEAV